MFTLARILLITELGGGLCVLPSGGVAQLGNTEKLIYATRVARIAPRMMANLCFETGPRCPRVRRT